LVTTLHSFDNADGANPYSALLQASDGNFYGTTALGGNIINCNGGCGTIFKIAPSGALLTLHKFDSTDGANPTGAMIEGADGNLYGTTENGGANNAGTVFKIDAQSALSTLHSFDGADGSNVFAGLVQGTDGNFYGTTIGGGVGFGTVFKITPAGVLTTLADLRYEAEPNAGLVQATDGNFYGATTFGGNTICNINGCGTLFEFTLNSGLSALHSFDGADGNYPTSSLLQATNGILYGTTTAGGSEGEGTVFSLDVGLGPFVAFVRSYGKVGQTGGILGQGFTGTTSVSLNGIPAIFSVKSDTYLTATVPPGATTGYVTVMTPSGTLTSNVPFRVLQ
jgi:uncharacterized repeat protein (TIGR03803 family)